MSEYGFRVKKAEGGGFNVFLPHQCDHWEITGDENYGVKGSSKTLAVKELTEFLAEGQRALEALRRDQEFGDAG